VDVAPTLLQALDIPRPPSFQGHGWFGAILGKEKTGSPAGVYCETYYPNEFGWSELRSWRTRDYKYILGPEPELYDLRIDSGEQKNLIAAKSAVAEQYKSALQAFEARFANQKATVEAQTQLSAEDQERFRALGYIGGPSQGRRPEALLRPDPKGKIDIYLLISRAMTQITQRQFQRALDTLRELLQRDSSITTVHSLLGQCYLQLKKYKEAEQAFELVLKQEPDRLYPLFYLGLAHFQQHQYDKAVPLLEKAILVDPKFFPAYNYLGLIYSDLGQASRAIDVFSKAAAIQENFQTYQMLGFLYAKQKQLEKAVAAFQKAAALEPDNALVHFHLAGVYALQGRKELAQKEFQTAVRLDPRLREKVK
jgi:tetratricopeptide (TPR) repeat protein